METPPPSPNYDSDETIEFNFEEFKKDCVNRRRILLAARNRSLKRVHKTLRKLLKKPNHGKN